MKEFCKYLVVTIFLFLIYSIKVDAQTCNGEIKFNDVTQICYEDTVYVYDLIYLNDTCKFTDYKNLLITIDRLDGSNYYLFNGTPDETEQLNLKGTVLKNVDAYSSTTVSISFMFEVKKDSYGEVFTKNYQFVRGMIPDFQLPESVNPIGDDGIPLSTIPLSKIFGEGIAKNCDINSSTANLDFINESIWNLHSFNGNKSKWHIPHIFEIDADEYLGCGSSTTLSLETKLEPEFEFEIGPKALLDQ